MIVELTDKKLVLRSFGTDFTIELGHQFFKVPNREKPGSGLKVVPFDMSKFVMTRKFPHGTTSDIANCVYDVIKRRWPSCEEKDGFLNLIQKFIAIQKEIRRDRFVLALGRLYGEDDAVWISAGIRTHVFGFPTGHLTEPETAQMVKMLREEYSGAAGAMQYPPQSIDQATRALFRYAGSKASSQFSICAQKIHATDDQVYAAFSVVKWLEEHGEEV